MYVHFILTLATIIQKVSCRISWKSWISNRKYLACFVWAFLVVWHLADLLRLSFICTKQCYVLVYPSQKRSQTLKLLSLMQSALQHVNKPKWLLRDKNDTDSSTVNNCWGFDRTNFCSYMQQQQIPIFSKPVYLATPVLCML